jgi:hypothetical protein
MQMDALIFLTKCSVSKLAASNRPDDFTALNISIDWDADVCSASLNIQSGIVLCSQE